MGVEGEKQYGEAGREVFKMGIGGRREGTRLHDLERNYRGTSSGE